jgi:hypothetical protein
MAGACGLYVGEKKCITYVRKPEKNHLEDLGRDGWMTLIQVLKKQEGRA